METPDHNSEGDRPTNSDSTDFGRVGASLVWVIRGAGHLVGTLLVAVLVALPIVDMRAANSYIEATTSGFLDPAWTDLALHLGLSACLWALGVIAWRLMALRLGQRNDDDRIVHAEGGSVMTETLIVLLPFLLLTSGLAQLAIRNVTGLMADLALYQGARTAWVWQAERNTNRTFPGGQPVNNTFITQQARLASAAALAPSAPGDFEMSSVGDFNHTGLTALRGTMYAMFADQTPAPNDYGAQSISNARAAASASTQDATPENLSFWEALDSASFETRAARKLSWAYLALQNYQVNLNGDSVSVQFQYQMNLVFPWFALVFEQGGSRTVAGRKGYYVPITRPRQSRGNRAYTLPEQIDPAF